jgi:hypothetical protein
MKVARPIWWGGGSKKSVDDNYSNYGSTVAPLDSTQHIEGKLDLNEHLNSL